MESPLPSELMLLSIGSDSEDEAPCQVHSGPESRAERLARAFDRSKATYNQSQVYTEKNWFLDPKHPRTEQEGKKAQQNTEYELSQLYLTRQYEEILHQSLSIPRPIYASQLDLILRAFLQLPVQLSSITTAHILSLANESRSSWKSSSGLSETASKVFLKCGENQDSLKAWLKSVNHGGAGRNERFLKLLKEILGHLSEDDGKVGEGGSQLKEALDQVNSSSTGPGDTAKINMEVLLLEVQSASLKLGLNSEETESLLACFKKLLSRVQGGDTEEEEVDMGRGVRSL